MQARLRQAALDAGVTMIAPETSLSRPLIRKFGNDVTIEPFVVIGPGVLDRRRRGDPFVFPTSCRHRSARRRRSRPYAAVAAGHLARRGAPESATSSRPRRQRCRRASRSSSQLYRRCAYRRQSNIGAVTITCNYDGLTSTATTIGSGAFVGSNSSLWRRENRSGAYVGSGSVITKDVPYDALRGAQSADQPRGRCKRYREINQGQASEGR